MTGSSQPANPSPSSPTKTIEFYFDVASPYSYLAATQIPPLVERTGALVVHRPFLLGGAFKAAGNEMPARVPNKARYMLRDLQDWAAYYGVPFNFPALFPVNSLRAMRCCTALAAGADAAKLPAYALGLFESYWVDGRDPSSPEAHEAAAARAGLDPKTLAEQAEAQPTKDALRAATDEAVKRGAFGAPTFFVGDRMYWGNDRMALLERALTAR